MISACLVICYLAIQDGVLKFQIATEVDLNPIGFCSANTHGATRLHVRSLSLALLISHICDKKYQCMAYYSVSYNDSFFLCYAPVMEGLSSSLKPNDLFRYHRKDNKLVTCSSTKNYSSTGFVLFCTSLQSIIAIGLMKKIIVASLKPRTSNHTFAI